MKLIQQYQNEINELRDSAKNNNCSDTEIDEIFIECFRELERTNSSNIIERDAHFCKHVRYFVKIFLIVLGLSLFIYVLLNVHQPTSSIVLRNVQGLIYPGLKVLRFLTVPLIRKFPILTDLYDESCLVENPYFYVPDMDCYPCQSVHSVMNLTGFTKHSLFQSGTPYIIKTDQQRITFQNLKETYFNHKVLLSAETFSIKSTNYNIQSLQELFTSSLSSNIHTVWRINKMATGRLLRQLFPRPPIISEWSGQSVERYVIIDGSNAEKYTLPGTECSYVSVIQGSGTRTIILKPSKECSVDCKTVSVVLNSSYILWYNWWYWRPISLPTENATETSVTYITSYC